MSLIMIGLWMGLLWLLVKVGVFKGWSMWMKVSPVAIYLCYLLIVAIPMNFTAPSGAAMVLRDSVQINPAVSGTVTQIDATSGELVEEGAVLFRLDPTPYESKVEALQARLELSRIRMKQALELTERQVGREFDVQTYKAEVEQLEADLQAATWNLEQTIVRAPARGFVPHIALQPGAQVAPPPAGAVMTFVRTDEVAMAAQIAQGYVRHIKPGQDVDIALKLYPGTIIKAKVGRVINVTPKGQVAPSGLALDSSGWSEQPFLVELHLEESLNLGDIPTGAYGTAVVYTAGMGTFGEIIRAVMLRTETWLNFL